MRNGLPSASRAMASAARSASDVAGSRSRSARSRASVSVIAWTSMARLSSADACEEILKKGPRRDLFRAKRQDHEHRRRPGGRSRSSSSARLSASVHCRSSMVITSAWRLPMRASSSRSAANAVRRNPSGSTGSTTTSAVVASALARSSTGKEHRQRPDGRRQQRGGLPRRQRHQVVREAIDDAVNRFVRNRLPLVAAAGEDEDVRRLVLQLLEEGGHERGLADPRRAVHADGHRATRSTRA